MSSLHDLLLVIHHQESHKEDYRGLMGFYEADELDHSGWPLIKVRGYK